MYRNMLYVYVMTFGQVHGLLYCYITSQFNPQPVNTRILSHLNCGFRFVLKELIHLYYTFESRTSYFIVYFLNSSRAQMVTFLVYKIRCRDQIVPVSCYSQWLIGIIPKRRIRNWRIRKKNNPKKKEPQKTSYHNVRVRIRISVMIIIILYE